MADGKAAMPEGDPLSQPGRRARGPRLVPDALDRGVDAGDGTRSTAKGSSSPLLTKLLTGPGAGAPCTPPQGSAALSNRRIPSCEVVDANTATAPVRSHVAKGGIEQAQRLAKSRARRASGAPPPRGGPRFRLSTQPPTTVTRRGRCNLRSRVVTLAWTVAALVEMDVKPRAAAGQRREPRGPVSRSPWRPER